MQSCDRGGAEGVSLVPRGPESGTAHSLQNFLGPRASSFRSEANILSLLFQSNPWILKYLLVPKMQPPHY